MTTNPNAAGVALLALALSLTACATPRVDESADGHMPRADSEAALDFEKTDWGRPFWATMFGRYPGGGAVRPPVTATSGTGGPLSPKLGVYIVAGAGGSGAAHELVAALQDNAAEKGLSVIGPTVMADIVSQRRVCQSSPADCLGALAAYPGIRALLVVQVTNNSTGNAAVQVQTRLMDADFEINYPAEAALVSIAGASDRAVSAEAWAQGVLSRAARRITFAPWLTHAFTRKNGHVYVSAGRVDGLTLGTKLEVHAGGSLVRAPGGQIVAWQPGRVVGKLKVVHLLGAHIAVTEVISGRAPQPDEKITIAGG